MNISQSPKAQPRRASVGRRAMLIATILSVLGGRAAAAVESLDLAAMSLEELASVRVEQVFGASKRVQSVTEAPSAVTVVSRDEIQKFGYRTLGEVLNGVRGFYVTSDRSYDFVGVRGLNRPGDYGGRILINIDGHRLNDPVYGASFVGSDFLLDLDCVERVEVIRGPGSSLYGNNAVFSVVNVVTRRGEAVAGVETAATAGSFDAYSGRVTWGKKFSNGLDVMLSGTYLEAEGEALLVFPEYAAINNGVAQDVDGTTSKNAFAAVSWGDFQLSGGTVNRHKATPTAQYFTAFNDPNFRNDDERSYAELKFQRELESGWNVAARSYYDQYAYNGSFPFDVGGPIVINLDRHRAQWAGSEVTVNGQVSARNRLTLGGEWRSDFDLRMGNADLTPPATYVASERDAYSYALYAENEFTFHTNLLLNAGLRYDYLSTVGDNWNPRVALIGRPWTDGTFKLLYGRAFRAPNEYEQRYIQPTYKANPNLRPEVVHSYELVYEQDLARPWHFTGSIFYNQVKGLIGQTVDPGDGLTYFENLDRVEIYGAEAELSGHWESGWRWSCSYTFAHARDEATGARLDNSPEHLGRARLAVPLWSEKLFLGVEVQAMSARATFAGGEVGALGLVNATLFSRELLKNLEWSVSVYNLFDRRYQDPASADYLQSALPQPGRTFRIKLGYRF